MMVIWKGRVSNAQLECMIAIEPYILHVLFFVPLHISYNRSEVLLQYQISETTISNYPICNRIACTSWEVLRNFHRLIDVFLMHGTIGEHFAIFLQSRVFAQRSNHTVQESLQ